MTARRVAHTIAVLIIVDEIQDGVPHSSAARVGDVNSPCCLGPTRRIHSVNRHQSGLSEGVMTEAAPAPLRGFFDQTTLHRIAVHVAQFLDALLRRPYIEVIEAGLPESFGWRVGEESALRELAAPRAHHSSRNTLLQSFDHH